MPRTYIKNYRSGGSGNLALFRKSQKAKRYSGSGRSGYQFVNRTPGAMAMAGEMKYFDCENTGTAVAAVGATWGASTRNEPTSTINIGAAAVATPLCLFAPTVGAGLNQRIGRKVNVRKLKVRGMITVPQQAAQAAADSPTLVRLLVLQDMQTNAAQFTASDVINGATGANCIVSYQNPNGFGRFRVLKDKIWTLGNFSMANETQAPAGLVQQGNVWSFKFTINFRKPVLVNFNATNGGTVADIIDNSFHIMAGCNSAAFAPSLTYYTRVSFTE